MGAIHFIRAPDYRFDILRLQQANALMRSANRAVAFGDDIELARLGVAACNRNGLDLQSSHFSTGINCVYPSQQTEIICE